MNEIGIVIELQEAKALVCIEDNIPAEGGCNGNCVSCTNNHKTKRNIWVKYNKDLDLHLTDKVEIYYSTGKTLKAAFMILILPLLLFFLFYNLGGLIFKVDNDLVSGLCGLGGIAFGFLFNYILFRFKKNTQLPEISRKIN